MTNSMVPYKIQRLWKDLRRRVYIIVPVSSYNIAKHFLRALKSLESLSTMKTLNILAVFCLMALLHNAMAFPRLLGKGKIERFAERYR